MALGGVSSIAGVRIAIGCVGIVAGVGIVGLP
jgi:hypothetical protein